MIDPKTCDPDDKYYGFVGGLERELIRADPLLDTPWSYKDNNGKWRFASDRNVSHLSTKPRFLIEPGPDVEDQENQKLHNEWMVEHIRANTAEERVRQLEDFILGADFNRVPEPSPEVDNNVYTWYGKYNVQTALGASVMLPAYFPRDLKAEEAIELGKFLYAAGQVSKGTK